MHTAADEYYILRIEQLFTLLVLENHGIL